jgi:hypothetical protein
LTHIDPDIFFSVLFSNSLSLYPSINMTYQVSYPYKTSRKTELLYASTFNLLGIKLENKRFWAEG